ncbi:MAG: ribonuclease III [Candidatus Zixiibacteriota bacterium]|nr:MAG: ribonuclease III [candidate division Zixibacteria bacterium]
MSFWRQLKNLFRIQNDAPPLTNMEKVQHIVGYRFRDESLLELALTHRSYHRQTDIYRPSNERLEYLGDSVLGLIIADQLYNDYPRLREGQLTKIKAMLVNETTLSTIGKEIKLSDHILMSPEEERLGGRDRASIISDAFESVIGAVYLDGGLEPARRLVLRHIYRRKEKITSDETQKNYKGELLELIQAKGDGMPRYDVVWEKGPDHEKQFKVVVFVGTKSIGTGIGLSKKEAEQKAAAMALEAYRSGDT